MPNICLYLRVARSCRRLRQSSCPIPSCSTRYCAGLPPAHASCGLPGLRDTLCILASCGRATAAICTGRQEDAPSTDDLHTVTSIIRSAFYTGMFRSSKDARSLTASLSCSMLFPESYSGERTALPPNSHLHPPGLNLQLHSPLTDFCMSVYTRPVLAVVRTGATKNSPIASGFRLIPCTSLPTGLFLTTSTLETLTAPASQGPLVRLAKKHRPRRPGTQSA